MLTVQISEETATQLFKDILIQDYRGMRNDIDKLLQKHGLEAYEKEDLEDWMRWIEAMAVLTEYYLSPEERKELIGEDPAGK